MPCAVRLPTTNETDRTKANQLASFPLNFLRTGAYFTEGKVYGRTIDGYHWSNVNKDEINANALVTDINIVYPKTSTYHGRGLALRCAVQGVKT